MSKPNKIPQTMQSIFQIIQDKERSLCKRDHFTDNLYAFVLIFNLHTDAANQKYDKYLGFLFSKQCSLYKTIMNIFPRS